MRHLKIIIIVLILFNATYAQDSLNCRLVSKTGSIVNAYGLAVRDNYAFVTSDKFYILEVSDINHPIVIYAENLGEWINAVSVVNKYVYLAAEHGLIILDISSLEHPKVLSHLKTTEYIEEVKVENDIAYLGTLDYSFLIVDVSDPTNPFEVNRVDKNIDDVWGIEIYDTLLFAASEDTGVKIFNITDPVNPVELGQIELYPNSTAVDMQLKDSVLFVTHPRDLHAFDISDLSNPRELYYLEGAGGNSIKLEGDYLFCASYEKLNVVDISNPSELKLVGYYPFPMPLGSDIYVKNKLVYATAQSNGIYFIQFDAPTSVQEKPNKLNEFVLSQNYPNPFNPSTNIKYSIPNSGIVQLKIYNLMGEEINTLVNEYQQEGTYEVEFNGNGLSSGIYYYRIISGELRLTKKMLLLK